MGYASWWFLVSILQVTPRRLCLLLTWLQRSNTMEPGLAPHSLSRLCTCLGQEKHAGRVLLCLKTHSTAPYPPTPLRTPSYPSQDAGSGASAEAVAMFGRTVTLVTSVVNHILTPHARTSLAANSLKWTWTVRTKAAEC